MAYDKHDNLTGMTTSSGGAYSYQYDSPFNFVTGVTDPNGHSASFSYDDKGNLTV